MDELKNTGQFKVSESILEKLQECFVSGRVSEEETLSEIAYSYQKYSEILCPHSAVGVFVGRKQSDADVPMVTLATAHPAKFPEAVNAKLDILEENTPSKLKEIMTMDESFSVVENNYEEVNNLKVPYEIVNRRDGDVAICYADPSKAYKSLGWSAKKDLSFMCKSAWEAINDNDKK